MTIPIYLDPFKNLSPEIYNLEEKRRALAALPDTEGDWPNPASLSRFGRTQMDWGQLRRFMKKVMLGDFGHHSPCWVWAGGTDEKGPYGRFYLGKDPATGQSIWAQAHRIAFEHWIGFPPAGYVVDHECNVKTCVNPTHLWPVTNNENLRLADQRRPWKRRNQYSKE